MPFRTPMQLALAQARRAAAAGEVPVGAVVVTAGGIVMAAAHNRTERDRDPTAHAELLAIRAACAVAGAPRLPDCDLYVTLEPCPMCAAAISFARIRRLYWAAAGAQGGGGAHGPRVLHQPTCPHRPELYPGLSEAEAADLLRDFFRSRR